MTAVTVAMRIDAFWSRKTAPHVIPAMALAAFLAMTTGTQAADRGTAAPDFVLPGTDGLIRLADYRGKVVYLDFWASWCGPCKRSFPWMNDLHARFGPQGVQVLAVNVDAKREDADRFLSSVPARFPIGFDPAGTMARAYAIKGMPSSVLIGRDGRMLLMHVGFNDSDKGDLEKQIEAALKQDK